MAPEVLRCLLKRKPAVRTHSDNAVCPLVCCTGTLDYMAPEVLRCPLKRQPADILYYAKALCPWVCCAGTLDYMAPEVLRCLLKRKPAVRTHSDNAVCPLVGCAGTLDYMAPEVLRCPLKRQPADNKDRPDLFYSQAVDAWAVGVLTYELLTGRWAQQCTMHAALHDDVVLSIVIALLLAAMCAAFTCVFVFNWRVESAVRDLSLISLSGSCIWIEKTLGGCSTARRWMCGLWACCRTSCLREGGHSSAQCKRYCMMLLCFLSSLCYC
jgi:hypothetical protein